MPGLSCSTRSFTLTVAKRLGVSGKYPGWINRAASWGSIFRQSLDTHRSDAASASGCSRTPVGSRVFVSLPLVVWVWLSAVVSGCRSSESPPKHLKPIDLPPPKESVFKTSTGYRMDGSTVAPKVGKKEEKKPEDKKPTGATPTASAKTPGRKNPWADPTFVPPGQERASEMSECDAGAIGVRPADSSVFGLSSPSSPGMRDPVVSGFAKPSLTPPEAYQPPGVRPVPK